MTPEQLQAIRDREAAATTGPWVAGNPGGVDEHTVYMDPEWEQDGDEWHLRNWAGMIYDEGGHTAADAQFIAHAREDVPALLAEVRVWKGHHRTQVARKQATHAHARRLAAALRHIRDLLTLTDDGPTGEHVVLAWNEAVRALSGTIGPEAVRAGRPEITCLCGDVFTTHRDMALHLAMVHDVDLCADDDGDGR